MRNVLEKFNRVLPLRFARVGPVMIYNFLLVRSDQVSQGFDSSEVYLSEPECLIRKDLRTNAGALKFGGASRDRTDGLVVANDALSQLSYSP